jgi:FKBP-type peptidyl-prolyl cis-trans isomerase
MQEGAGEGVRGMQTVSVDYRGMLTDGKVFDESYKRGQQFSFTVGAGMVIKGWDEGLLGMKVGEKRRLTIPGDLAYGPNGIPGVIPANATLVFDIELHSIK